MHLTIPPSENEQDVAAIKRAIDKKHSEVLQADQKAAELRAEIRGLHAALQAIGGGRLSD